LVSPFALQAIWLLMSRLFPAAEFLGLILPVTFVAIGFVFVAFEFRWRALFIGLVYFPAMFYLLIGFSIVFAGVVLHDSL
jgi:hypothetical protein